MRCVWINQLRSCHVSAGANMVAGGENTFGIASLSNRDSFFGGQPVLSQVRQGETYSNPTTLERVHFAAVPRNANSCSMAVS